eukprot:NODE_10281_length_600_cov_86.639413_g10007_i0.p1 GENE.NODE_10281_length_600_cov_86.639413_g10007_i0~~NODE_10281_length_600_cov_86.639413_g10007_i0.p1  ORF type:complete len:174 (+),score=35.73 NODE_10281_length_600_cov_86.639413_g10007_i0:60-524(+)
MSSDLLNRIIYTEQENVRLGSKLAVSDSETFHLQQEIEHQQAQTAELRDRLVQMEFDLACMKNRDKPHIIEFPMNRNPKRIDADTGNRSALPEVVMTTPSPNRTTGTTGSQLVSPSSYFPAKREVAMSPTPLHYVQPTPAVYMTPTVVGNSTIF